MSGTATSPFAIDPNSTDASAELAQKVNCPSSPTLEMVKCLQQIPVEKLVESDSSIEVIL